MGTRDENHSAAGPKFLSGRRAHLSLLFAAAAFALLWRLGSGSLEDWDEAIYAEVAKEMARGGGWLTPTWEWRPWFEKPPLLVWATAALFGLFGVTEFWARAASAFSGVGLVLVTYLLGEEAFDRAVGLAAAFVLLTSYHFVSFARFGTTDVMLTFFTWLALYSYLRTRRGDGRGAGGEKWWYAAWLSAALAVMTKGAAGLVAPAVVALMLPLDGRLRASLRSRHFWAGAAVALAVVAPWHVAMCVRHGRAFVEEYFGYHTAARLTSALEGHAHGSLFYAGKILDGFFPWCLLLPFAVFSAARATRREDARARIFLAAAALVLVAYTLIPTKLAWYVLPAYPALAVLVAAFLVRLCRAPRKRPLFRRAIVAACAALALLGAAYSALLVSVRDGEEGGGHMAELARRAAPASGEDREALILFSEPEPLEKPAAVFYAGRPVRLAYRTGVRPSLRARRYEDPERIEDVAGDAVSHVILPKDQLGGLAADYETSVLAESGPLVYASLRRRR